MTLFAYLPFAAAILAVALGFAAMGRRHSWSSVATWCFFGGMLVLGIDSLATGFALRASELEDVVNGLMFGLFAKSLAAAAWLSFSLTYSRGGYRESLQRWRVPLAIVAVLPMGLSLGFRDQLLQLVPVETADGIALQLHSGAIAKLVNVMLLLVLVLTLMNLEQTFRAAIGTMRWRIKFVVVGLAVIFGAQMYVRSQAVLFSAYDARWSGLESSALLVGCLFLVLAWARTGAREIDVYPSRAVLRSSLTVGIVGAYLFLVGILAQVARRFGGTERFQLQAFVVLIGLAGLAVLLLSDRFKQRVRAFVGRHFAMAQHDSVTIWTRVSQDLAHVRDQAALSAVSVKLVSEIFNVLSVRVWLVEQEREQLMTGEATHNLPTDVIDDQSPRAASAAVAAGLRPRIAPFDLERVNEPWAEELRQLNAPSFRKGGDRWCVPLRSGDDVVGAIVLADRVDGAGYTEEELALLQCIAGQVTSVVLNLRLGNEVARARELEAFRAMSAFFVHDLKNAAASLNLMLKNARSHFDDPVFRQDALRGIGNMARRIDEMIARLTALRQRPDLKPVEADLNQVVNEALEGVVNGTSQIHLTKELQPLPSIFVDRAQLRSVISNLVLNARDAVGEEGSIQIRTERLGSSVVLSVSDNGCGMSAAFVRNSLFRPFQSTKKKGLGIGMFQSRIIVEAHGGSIRVESDADRGTTFRVSLPVRM